MSHTESITLKAGRKKREVRGLSDLPLNYWAGETGRNSRFDCPDSGWIRKKIKNFSNSMVPVFLLSNWKKHKSHRSRPQAPWA